MASCTTYHWQIGQTANAFFELNKKHIHKFDLVRQSADWSVYKVGGNEDQQPIFFYFRNNLLYQVDRGMQAPDIIIQNR